MKNCGYYIDTQGKLIWISPTGYKIPCTKIVHYQNNLIIAR